MALPEKVYVRDHHRLAGRLDASFPRAAFAGATLDRLFTGDGLAALDPEERDRVVAFNRDFLDCECQSNPYCGHAEEKFCRWLLEERLEGHDPEALIDTMGEAYHLYAYPGDVVGFLDEAIRRLDAVADLAAVEGDTDYANRTSAIRRGLEAGRHPSR